MAEWSIATVLKTVDCYRSGGSNPSLSATQAWALHVVQGFFVFAAPYLCIFSYCEKIPFINLHPLSERCQSG